MRKLLLLLLLAMGGNAMAADLTFNWQQVAPAEEPDQVSKRITHWVLTTWKSTSARKETVLQKAMVTGTEPNFSWSGPFDEFVPGDTMKAILRACDEKACSAESAEASLSIPIVVKLTSPVIITIEVKEPQ